MYQNADADFVLQSVSEKKDKSDYKNLKVITVKCDEKFIHLVEKYVCSSCLSTIYKQNTSDPVQLKELEKMEIISSVQ